MVITFLRDEMARRGFGKAVIGISGGVDSAVTAYLAARALGAENVLGVRMPYRTSSPDSLAHAQLVADALGIPCRTVDISAAVDGYLASVPDASPGRRGNVMARVRMITLFDLSAEIQGVPLGTGNKTERLFGYFNLARRRLAPHQSPGGPVQDAGLVAGAAPRRFNAIAASRPPRTSSAADRRRGLRVSYAKADELLTGCSAATPRPISWRVGSTRRKWSSSAAAGAHTLEAPAADRGDAEPLGDRRVVSAPWTTERRALHLKLKAVTVGHSELERRNAVEHVASGVFRPGLGWDLVQPIFELEPRPSGACRRRA